MLSEELRDLRRILRYRNMIVRTAVKMKNKMSPLFPLFFKVILAETRLSENRIECSDGYFFPGTGYNDSAISLAEFLMATLLRNFLKALPNQNRNNMI
ncbi:MAG: hypothetical protein Q7U03_07585, partial [Syntrophales bacterium]|nr:hypothetical protein [Syntrophales bacterium]